MRTTNPSPCVEKGIYSALATLRHLRLVPLCFVISDLEPFLFYFDFSFDISKSFPCRFNFRRISLTGFLARSVRSSNIDVLDSPCLHVLVIETSQSRQHVDTRLIHIESRKSPTAELFEVDS
ncbi:hypothetical protein Tco_0629876 [Tanacetum coccineum]|uniref:Uncharacterized protein n=1 Tax=Tanacetum coccineum TaxID=301880 RepID=A0ABQ4WUE2_9ASTR